MILVRDIFQVKFGRMKEAKDLWREGAKLMEPPGGARPRVLTDLMGQYYTLVIESTYRSLTDYESFSRQGMSRPGMGEWYKSFAALIESGRREIFTVEEEGTPA
jgi:hypothetical protein